MTTTEKLDDDLVESIRKGADIVAVIRLYVPLARFAHQFRGVCPFHQTTHATLEVSPATGLYYCHVCNAGGDVFEFVRRKHDIPWGDAVRQVASMCHECGQLGGWHRTDPPCPRGPIQ